MKEVKVFIQDSAGSPEELSDAPESLFASEQGQQQRFDESGLSNIFVSKLQKREQAKKNKQRNEAESDGDEFRTSGKIIKRKQDDRNVPESKRKSKRNSARIGKNEFMSEMDTQSKTKSKSTGLQQRKQSEAKVEKTSDKRNKDGLMVSINGLPMFENGVLVRHSIQARVLYMLMSVVTLFTLNLINFWLNDYIYMFTVLKPVDSIDQATGVILRDDNGKAVLVKLRTQRVFLTFESNFESQVFEHDYSLYFWNKESQSFQSLRNFVKEVVINDLVSYDRKGRSEEEARHGLITFGRNNIGLGVKPLLLRIKNQMFSLMNVFQMVSVVLLYFENHYWYSLFIICFLLYRVKMIISSSLELSNLLKTNKRQSDTITVVRRQWDGSMRKRLIEFEELVPGDLVELTNGLDIEADLLMIQGQCVVKCSLNIPEEQAKSVLKESFDVTKKFDKKRHIVEAGNQIAYTLTYENESCLALVIQTGFYTQRMKFLRKTINTPRSDIPNRKDLNKVFKFLIFLCFLMCFWFLMFTRIFRGMVAIRELVSKIIQITIICLKPTLPAAIMVSYYLSEKRLLGHSIWTRFQTKIFKAKSVKYLISELSAFKNHKFETKGFLLSQECDNQNPVFQKLMTKPSALLKASQNSPTAQLFVQAFSFCNHLIKLGQSIIGSEVDKAIFKSSPYEVIFDYLKSKTPVKKYRLKISKHSDMSHEYLPVKVFDQNAESMTLSVIVKCVENGEYILFSRCSSEAVSSICSQNSIPFQFTKMNLKLNAKGYQAIAYSYRIIHETELERSKQELEQGMTFLGFYLLQEEFSESYLKWATELTEKEVDYSIFSSKSNYETFAFLKNKGIIPMDMSVIFGQTQSLTSADRILWTRLSVVDSSHKISLEERTGIAELENESAKSQFWKKSVLILDGKTALSLLKHSDNAVRDFVIRNTIAFCQLNISGRQQIIKAFKAQNKQEKVFYMFKEAKHNAVAENSTISFCIGPMSMFSNASFASLSNSIGGSCKVLREGLTTHKNTSKNFRLTIFFLLLQFAGLIILFSKRTNFAISQLLFMDFWVLFLLAFFQSMIVYEKPNAKARGSGIISKRQIFVLGSELAIATKLLMGNLVFLWNVRFYQRPIDLMEEDAPYASPEEHYFFEPFLIFWSIVVLTILFSFSKNKNAAFNDSYGNKGYLFGYLALLLAIVTVMIFVHKLTNPKWLFSSISKTFRIPYLLGGFDNIVFFKIFFDLAILYMTRVWCNELFDDYLAEKPADKAMYSQKPVHVSLLAEGEIDEPNERHAIKSGIVEDFDI